MSRRIELICVGNELLIGKTLNTNANWLAQRVTALGVTLKRITTVGDEIDEIKMAINHALQRKARLIITTGGLGPTHDDMTLKGVAEALDIELVVNEKALEMVKEKYEAYFKEGRMDKVELTPSRIKMATIPEGAQPLPNPVGTAPGVILDVKESLLISLPGVPSEMKAIFEESVKPLILQDAGETLFFEKNINVDGIMESALAPLIDEVMRENPYVYVKSHPKGEERKPYIEIHFSTITEDSEVAKGRLKKATNRMYELIARKRRHNKP